jgi:hypothetical protein
MTLQLKIKNAHHTKYTLAASLLVAAFICVLGGCRAAIPWEEAGLLETKPEINPDISDTMIPPNIAPLNFKIREKADRYAVRIHGDSGKDIVRHSVSGRILLPAKKWRALLEANRGGQLQIDIAGRRDGAWQRFSPITCRIAAEEIDSHFAYRMMKPIFTYWRNIGIYQRNLENFKARPILHGSSFKEGCVNCHTFLNNSPEKMFIGIRSVNYGVSTLYVEKDKVSKIGAKWGYTSWHPNGRMATYPIMAVHQFFHSSALEIRDVVDLDSSLVYYDFNKQKTFKNPGGADTERLESYPCWSPDGRTLYFSSALIPWKDRSQIPPENYDKALYDLMRISYNPDTGIWGEPEIFLSSAETGLSILEPRISPDGRFLLFCMCDYGIFPVFQPSSDLYMMDLQSKEYRRLDINSGYSESWHSWSSNSRWIAFSSKRLDGLFTRPFFSYVDEKGRVYKPFILPQRDPEFYQSFLRTFSVPELITGPIRISQKTLVKAIRSSKSIEVDTFTSASPKSKKATIRE